VRFNFPEKKPTRDRNAAGVRSEPLIARRRVGLSAISAIFELQFQKESSMHNSEQGGARSRRLFLKAALGAGTTFAASTLGLRSTWAADSLTDHP
jgi:hypothetical protein